MTTFIMRRLLGMIPTLFAIIILAFCVVRLAPGSPFTSDKALPPAVKARLEAKFGLDKPVIEHLIIYFKMLSRGDLGDSTKYGGRSVREIISDGFPATIQLGLAALVWAMLLGLITGVVGAVRQNSLWDYGAMTIAMVGISVPTFVLGPILIFIFSLTLFWLPPAGWGELRHLILPAITLGTAYAAYIARLTRGGMLEVVRADYIRTAHAKGLSEWTVVTRHMLKGGLLPVVTFLGPAVANIMVGSIVVEKIFATPGIGPYFVDAAFNRDLFLLMGIVIIYSVFLLIMNLVVDILYAVLDPRVRF